MGAREQRGLPGSGTFILATQENGAVGAAHGSSGVMGHQVGTLHGTGLGTKILLDLQLTGGLWLLQK